MMCAPGPISGATARLIFTQTHDTVPSDRDCRPARCIAKALVKRGKAGDALATSDPVSDERVVRSVVLSAALMATARGIPMLLAGEESLEFRSEPWPVPPHFDGARGGRGGAAAGVFACYRALLHLRRNVVPATGAEGVTAGLTGDHVRVVHDNPHVGVVVWHRWRSGGPGDDTIIVANLGTRDFPGYRFGLPRGGEWAVRFFSGCYSAQREDLSQLRRLVSARQPRGHARSSSHGAGVGVGAGAGGSQALVGDLDAKPLSAADDVVDPTNVLVVGDATEQGHRVAWTAAREEFDCFPYRVAGVLPKHSVIVLSQDRH